MLDDGLPEGYKPSFEVRKVLLNHALLMRTMSPQMVALYLDKHLPEVEGHDRLWTIKHYAGTKRTTHRKAQPQDSLFGAAMFMAGVSLGDLGMLFGIRKQTVAQKVQKHATPEERATMRDNPMMIDLEALQLAKTIFDDAVIQGLDPAQITPLELGRGLLSASHALIAAERGTDEIPDRPRRYSNMNTSTGQEVAKAIIAQVQQKQEQQEADSTAPQTPPTVVRPEEQSFLDTL